MPQVKDVTDNEILPQSERLRALSPEEYELLWGPRRSLTPIENYSFS